MKKDSSFSEEKEAKRLLFPGATLRSREREPGGPSQKSFCFFFFRKRRILAFLILALLPVAIHWPELTGWLSSNPIYLTAGLTRDWHPNGIIPSWPGWIDGNAGATLQALGRLVARDWLHGIVPWWNPYSGVGMPLAGEMQPAAFFLPFVLLLGLANGVLYLKIAMQIMAGLATYALLRRLGLRVLPALTGGILFQLNGTFAWAADSPILPVAFLPVLLLGVENAVTAALTRSLSGWMLIAIALAYSIVAGFPETAYIDGLLCLAWSLLRLAQMQGSRVALLWRLAAGCFTGLLLASPALVAFVSFLSQSSQLQRDYTHFHMPAPLFAQFLFPYLFGPIFFGDRFQWFLLNGYIGLPVAAMATLGIILPGPRPQRALHAVLLAWACLALGKIADLPLITAAWNAVPLIPWTSFNRYAMPSVELACIILVAFAVDDAMRYAGAVSNNAMALTRFRLAAAAAGVLSLAVAAILFAEPTLRELHKIPGAGTWLVFATTFGVMIALGALLIRAAPIAGPRRGLLLAATLAADAVVQFSIPLFGGTRGSARELDTQLVGFLRQNLGLQRFYTLGPFGPNYGAYYSLASINHIYAPVAKSWADHIHTALDPLADTVSFNGFAPPPAPGQESRPQALRRRAPAYEDEGVKYVIEPAFRGDEPPAEGARLVYKTPLATVFQLPNPAPYFQTQEACTLTPLTRQAVDANCKGPATLIRSELYFPGWTATVNGTPAVVTKDGIFQSVTLPDGMASIRFQFAPPGAGLAFMAAAAAAAAIAAQALIYAVAKRERAAATCQPES